MSSKIITSLNAYTATDITGSIDLLYITDMTAMETKKITALQLATYASTTLGIYTGSFSGSLIGNVSGSLFGTASWANNAVSASYAPSSGETNTASNTGSYGYGLSVDKVGVDLRFKKIGQGTNVTIAPDPSDSNVLLISAETTTTAGGSVGNIQFKSPAGTFTGNDNLIWEYVNNNLLTVTGTISASAFSSSAINAVGFFGTASVAISASRAISSSNAISSSYALSGSYCVTSSYSSRQDLGISTDVSTSTVDAYKGSKYTFTHGLGSTPKFFKCVLICTVNDTAGGYSQFVVDDEIEAAGIWRENNDNDWSAITSWTNATLLGASCLNDQYTVNNKNTGHIAVLDPTKWKIKFYYA